MSLSMPDLAPAPLDGLPLLEHARGRAAGAPRDCQLGTRITQSVSQRLGLTSEVTGVAIAALVDAALDLQLPARADLAAAIGRGE
jgi:hypothetical protein